MDNKIGLRFKEARKNIIKINQPDLCEKLGISSRTTISNWETNRAQPTLKYLQAMSDMFDINLHWLLTGEGSPTKTAKVSTYNSSKKIINKGQIGNISGNMRISNMGNVNNNNSSNKNVVTNYNSPPKPPTTNNLDVSDKLLKFVELLEKGLITDEEFKIVKEGLLGTG